MTITAVHGIWVVRHAETDWTGVRWCGRADPPLNDQGRAAATRLAGELKAAISSAGDEPPPPAILSSPLRRARATAEVLAARLEAGVEELDELAEIDFGTADGLIWRELEARHPSVATAVLAGADVDWPAGESAGAVRERARLAARQVLAAGAARSVVVVSHARFLVELASQLGATDHPGLRPAGFSRLDPVNA